MSEFFKVPSWKWNTIGGNGSSLWGQAKLGIEDFQDFEITNFPQNKQYILRNRMVLSSSIISLSLSLSKSERLFTKEWHRTPRSMIQRLPPLCTVLLSMKLDGRWWTMIRQRVLWIITQWSVVVIIVLLPQTLDNVRIRAGLNNGTAVWKYFFKRFRYNTYK